ncbi:putative ATP-dependent Lon-type protease (plasmid) [Thioflavicoccus mobilis 8321]|uniref:Putative ATP-dependent Lon-type protease n=1 Tax=Thioflavicoccus mobilis 8321 TaxID=765912 RepID=L0H4A3_9GAMM|nr:BREX system Lon protease-like protein BrxL [Thioflavicoccus mobilis]AGA92429.1 putative ATP-dependent Lon-type protease [Thioflavicoccus mobilis 8321]
MDALDTKLNEVFSGRVVRKDLVQQVKKGTNVPTFVLEFLLAKYCASNDPDEIAAGIEATLEYLARHYVRPDESNKAQSTVQQKGTHKYVDKVHVRHVEKEKRHWAAMENFNSQRIAINQKFYKDNDRLLEGGLWAEVTVGYNDVEDDNYAFYVEDLRPIQLSRFDFDRYLEGRARFTRDEWMDIVLRSVGLKPSKLSPRLKLHFIARLLPLVEPNYNFIELGPRGTGKSYFFSEFSPYATLVSGGQATKATLFYNNARGKVGLVGFWDAVAFDEVAGIKIKDQDAIQIMKDYMANGRFSRGVEVIANASMAFVGNIDESIHQLVNSTEHDLFLPLPAALDLAVMDRFYCYLPGWEIPKNSSAYLTGAFGFITDYLAEAFHHLFKQTNRYEYVNSHIRLGPAVEGRDEKGIKKTVAAFLKILHPGGAPEPAELEEYVAYAVEARRRVKEQMNKRKPDDEFARINLSYFGADGSEVVVYCPESKGAPATQSPSRRTLDRGAEARAPTASTVEGPAEIQLTRPAAVPDDEQAAPEHPREPELKEQHFTILYGDTGYTYDSLIGPYLAGARSVTIEDPYIRAPHQIANFVRFCETVSKTPGVRSVTLVTSYDDQTNLADLNDKLGELKQSLMEVDIVLEIRINEKLHDREIRLDNGWIIKLGRGLDFYQKPESWFAIGASDFSLRKCLETKVDIFREAPRSND